MARFKGGAYSQIAPGRSYNPTSGVTIRKRWRGLAASLASLEAELRSKGVRYEIDPEPGGYAVLTTNGPDEDAQDPEQPIVDEWTVDGGTREKSIKDHPKIVAQWDIMRAKTTLNAALVDSMAQLKSYIEQFLSGAREVPDATDSSQMLPLDIKVILSMVTAEGMDPRIWRQYIEERMVGEDAYVIPACSLTHNRVVLARGSIKASRKNVGRVFRTTEALRSIEQVPDDVRVELPDGVWLKMSAKADRTAPGKWTLVEEWQWADSYSGFAYEEAQP